LAKAKTMGDWYRLTQIAASAVGEKVVEQCAAQAEKELDALAANTKPLNYLFRDIPPELWLMA